MREDDELTGEGSGLLELVEPPQEEQPPLTTFTTLAVDNNLELVGHMIVMCSNGDLIMSVTDLRYQG